HGAGPVELVPAVRPQPPDLRPERLLGRAAGLREGHPAGLPRTGPHEFRRTTRRLFALAVDPTEASYMPTDANVVENARRPVAVHRKSYFEQGQASSRPQATRRQARGAGPSAVSQRARTSMSRRQRRGWAGSEVEVQRRLRVGEPGRGLAG